MNLDDKRVLITGGSSVPVTDVAAPLPVLDGTTRANSIDTQDASSSA